MEGNIFDIQRFSIGNGPGIRTTVFMKGCSLHCPWCHNPESISPARQIKVNFRLCRNCGMCVKVCPNGVHRMEDGQHRIEPSRCTGCGRCEAACCYGSVQLLGTAYQPQQLAELLHRDRDYYEASGGGVTFSGGEPMLQFPFIRETAALLQGIGIYIDTCGNCGEAAFAEMLELADGVLFDLKHMDTARHKQLTGAGNDRILQNFELAAASRVQLTVRYPMIPGQNDDDKNLEDMCRFLLMHGIDRLDVSPYHDYGCSKYEDLGMQATVFPKHTPEQLEQRLQVIRSFGITPIII